jgi:LmbE family N-acetylglucosaminyl deacetylase
MSDTLASLRTMTRQAMGRIAHDETRAAAQRSALVLAPHPDDETLGCGATILRKVAAGTRVTIAVVTDGQHSHDSVYLPPAQLAALRRVEMSEAARRLGLTGADVHWGGFVDGELRHRGDEVVSFVTGLLTSLRPDEVYVTCAVEPHPDHAALGRAARRAVACVDASVRLWEYPVWLWGSWPLRKGERLGSMAEAVRMVAGRRVSKVHAGEFLPGKLSALQAHASQLWRPAAVPETADWPVLPSTLLAAAAEPYELFLPWHPSRARPSATN